MTSPAWQPGTRLVGGVLLILFIGWIIYGVRQLALPLLFGLFLAYLLHPLVSAIVRWTKIPRWAAVVVIYVLMLTLLVGSTTRLGLAASGQVLGIVEDLGMLANDLPQRLSALSVSSFIVGPWVIDLSGINLDPFIDQISAAIQPILLGAGSLLASFAGTAASALGILFLVMIIGFYLLLDFDIIRTTCLNLVPDLYEDDISKLFDETGRVWQAFLRGQLILGLAIGLIVSVTLTILGVRFAIGLGIIAGLLEFVPIFGPLISGLIAGLVALFQSGNWLGLTPGVYVLVVLLAFIVIQQVENNLLVPRIIGHSLNLNPLIVLLAALAGGILAGVIGLLLAAPIVATLRLWAGYFYRKIVGLGTIPEPVLGPPRERKRFTFLRRMRGWFAERRTKNEA
ncbi:MAG: AI-2E family transporter [Chloroflexi bacterium]|nr:AI-2E family transporter [Chloroflexota bacterium]